MGISWGAQNLVAGAAVTALLLTPAATAQAAARTGTITQVDVAADGTTANGSVADIDISDDGRYAAFASHASNLTRDDTNEAYDVFVRDLRKNTTTLISRGLDGHPANDQTLETVISGNGRYVAFTSSASNLVADDTNGTRDVFVHDRRTGVTTRASVTTGNGQFAGQQTGPSISDDGRYVTFIVTDFLNGNGQLAYLHDMRTGVTTRVTVPTGADSAQAAVFEATISGNGKRLAFSGTGDFAGDGGSASAVYLSDLATGAVTRISPQTLGDEAVGASGPDTDRAGTKVLFSTNAGLDPSDTNAGADLYLRDLTADATVLVTANRAGTGAGNSESYGGSLSADGRNAGFYSSASDLVARDPNGAVTDVFLRDLGRARTTLVTRTPSGAGANSYSWTGTPSGDGSRVLFTSAATNLATDPVNDPGDDRVHVYVSCLRNC